MPQLAKLFEPGKIGKLALPNRIILAPLGNAVVSDEGYVTSRIIDYFVERAKGGAGYLLSGGSSVLPKGRTPGAMWVFDDKFIPKLQELAQAVHQCGVKMGIQLNHLGKTLSAWKDLTPDDIDTFAPSPIPWVFNNFTPREGTKKDILTAVEAFSEAGRRLKDGGFGGVEIHAGHGYLISSFFSPYFNRRKDEYGGTPENRARFACEILRRTREKVGPDFAISIRISGADFMPGGITLDDTLIQAPLLVQAGADALHISASSQETTEWQFISYLYPDATLVNLAAAVKKVVNVPVITVGKIGDPVLANQIIEEGKADFVAIGRPLLADPYLPNKAKEGKFEEIRRCIFCNNCWSRVQEQRHKQVYCTVNPAVGREREFILKRTSKPKKVMVVGGGVAGMKAAAVLAERGHQVSLYEQSGELGGQWNIACRQKHKEKLYPTVIEHLRKDLERSKAKIILNQEVTVPKVLQEKPDAIVLSTGAEPRKLDIPGGDGKNVVQANDVVMGKVPVGQRVIVVGGRMIGMEVAIALAEQGKRVSIITLRRLGENGRELDHNIYRTLRDRLIELGVFIFPDSPAVEIKDTGIYIAHNRELVFLKADTIVLAAGATPNNKLSQDIKDLAPEIYQIGDCVKPRDAMDAIREGAEVGLKI
jgi:2,4-dienoyl-CoA reductase-like NADH-dependent reductase (Old Yellow Enzyme family)/thioredoxin reductase